VSNTNSTNSAGRQEVTRLTLEESALVTSARAAKITGYTYTIPARWLARCPWCHAVVAVVTLLNGSDEHVDLEIEQGEARALLTSPHTCSEAKRFSDSHLDDAWDGDAQ
jgi:hypothetical protein